MNFDFLKAFSIHRKSRQIRVCFRKLPIIHRTCAKCSQLPTYISTIWYRYVISVASAAEIINDPYATWATCSELSTHICTIKYSTCASYSELPSNISAIWYRDVVSVALAAEIINDRYGLGNISHPPLHDRRHHVPPLVSFLVSSFFLGTKLHYEVVCPSLILSLIPLHESRPNSDTISHPLSRSLSPAFF